MVGEKASAKHGKVGNNKKEEGSGSLVADELFSLFSSYVFNNAVEA